METVVCEHVECRKNALIVDAIENVIFELKTSPDPLSARESRAVLDMIEALIATKRDGAIGVARMRALDPDAS